MDGADDGRMKVPRSFFSSAFCGRVRPEAKLNREEVKDRKKGRCQSHHPHVSLFLFILSCLA